MFLGLNGPNIYEYVNKFSIEGLKSNFCPFSDRPGSRPSTWSWSDGVPRACFKSSRIQRRDEHVPGPFDWSNPSATISLFYTIHTNDEAELHQILKNCSKILCTPNFWTKFFPIILGPNSFFLFSIIFGPIYQFLLVSHFPWPQSGPNLLVWIPSCP